MIVNNLVAWWIISATFDGRPFKIEGAISAEACLYAWPGIVIEHHRRQRNINSQLRNCIHQVVHISQVYLIQPQKSLYCWDNSDYWQLTSIWHAGSSFVSTYVAFAWTSFVGTWNVQPHCDKISRENRHHTSCWRQAATGDWENKHDNHPTVTFSCYLLTLFCTAQSHYDGNPHLLHTFTWQISQVGGSTSTREYSKP